MARDKRVHIEALFADAAVRLETIEATFLGQVRAERGPLQDKLLARLDAVPVEQVQVLDLSR